MQHCPLCKSDNIQRSRSRSWWEQLRKEITNKRPYRCRGCGWRGWGCDTGPRPGPAAAEFAAGQLAPDPANRKDNGFPGAAGRRRTVSLAALDSLEPKTLTTAPTPGKTR
jgi:hypothetical protein